ncbi:sigma-70 family RNA polymerase sigma factor [Kribbella hippodromi]|uniref:Sigma-70 family RNA polymerase sigma factor n=1 Tax=Kribbella hippodromi TaxID=434347 RepID=A0ABN2DT79_9ACTN
MATDTVTDVVAAVAEAHVREWAFVLAATARVAADLDLAEDCVQDAYAKALVHWREAGVPRRPGAWLTTVATRRALELRRRADVARRKLPLLVDPVGADPVGGEAVGGELGGSDAVGGEAVGRDADGGVDAFPDDRLRLVFTCCHPALAQEAQVALTLRLVCGLTSAEIATAFLVKEATMQARITRAKHKISRSGIPYRIPRVAELPERIGAVLDVVHLVYAAGHTAGDGAELTRPELADRGLDLARMMRMLLPDDAEVAGLLALLLLTEARRPARVDEAGQLVLMENQDRTLWDQQLIAEGLRLVPEALTGGTGGRGRVGRFGVMAAVGAVHAEAGRWEETDWGEILGLYDVLYRRWPSPVVALNRIVALSYVAGPATALEQLEELSTDPALATYPYLASTRAELLRRTGRSAEAQAAYEEALAFTSNSVEADFLQRRITPDA